MEETKIELVAEGENGELSRSFEQPERSKRSATKKGPGRAPFLVTEDTKAARAAKRQPRELTKVKESRKRLYMHASARRRSDEQKKAAA